MIAPHYEFLRLFPVPSKDLQILFSFNKGSILFTEFDSTSVWIYSAFVLKANMRRPKEIVKNFIFFQFVFVNYVFWNHCISIYNENRDLFGMNKTSRIVDFFNSLDAKIHQRSLKTCPNFNLRIYRRFSKNSWTIFRDKMYYKDNINTI